MSARLEKKCVVRKHLAWRSIGTCSNRKKERRVVTSASVLPCDAHLGASARKSIMPRVPICVQLLRRWLLHRWPSHKCLELVQ